MYEVERYYNYCVDDSVEYKPYDYRSDKKRSYSPNRSISPQ